MPSLPICVSAEIASRYPSRLATQTPLWPASWTPFLEAAATAAFIHWSPRFLTAHLLQGRQSHADKTQMTDREDPATPNNKSQEIQSLHLPRVFVLVSKSSRIMWISKHRYSWMTSLSLDKQYPNNAVLTYYCKKYKNWFVGFVR